MNDDTRAVSGYTSYKNLAAWLRQSKTLSEAIGAHGFNIEHDESAVMVCLHQSEGPDSEVVISVEDGEIGVELIWPDVRYAEGVRYYVPRSKTTYIDLDTEPTVASVVAAIESLTENS